MIAFSKKTPLLLLSCLFIFICSCSKNKKVEDEQLAVLLMNSSSEPLRVTFEKRAQNGTLISPIYLEEVLEAHQKVKKVINPAVYKIKVWDQEDRLAGQVRDFNFELHTDSTLEHPYYLDLALNKSYSVTDLDFIYTDTSNFDFTDLKIFKVYDGKEPFEIAEAVRYHDIIFLEDKIPHQLNEHKKLYCVYPVPYGLNKKHTHAYLQEQIRVHYNE